jgi:hypothetical protein
VEGNRQLLDVFNYTEVIEVCLDLIGHRFSQVFVDIDFLWLMCVTGVFNKIVCRKKYLFLPKLVRYMMRKRANCCKKLGA